MFPSCSDVLRITRNKTMLERFFETDSDKTLFAQRIVLGGVMLPHGAQKLLGWFGGHGGSDPTMSYPTGTLHLPAVLAFLVIMSEALGSLGLVFGLGTRLAAF